METLRRAAVLLILGSLLGIFFASLLGPTPVMGGDVPPELKAEPQAPTARAKDFSRPIIEATRRVRPAVVQIVSYALDRRRQWRPIQSGSGILVSQQGHILTNRHVINGAQRLEVLLNDGRVFEKVRALGADPRSDVAIVLLEGAGEESDLPIAPLGDSDSLEVGEMVIAIGAPFGLESSVSIGVVSATGRGDLLGEGASEDFIQTDAALNRGNSGGPLINLDGQVVGINTAIQGVTGANVGVGYSIPINLARAIAVALIERGTVRHGYLGILGRFLSAQELIGEGVQAKGGYVVTRVLRDSPAEAAGIRKGDVITAVNERPLRRLGNLVARLAQAGPGGELELTCYRDGEERTIRVQLAEQRIYTYGIEVENLDPRRARDLNLPPETLGVVVTRIEEDSVAGQAPANNRLLPGDVIIRIDWPGHRQYIRNRADFEQVMSVIGSSPSPPREIHFIIRTKEDLYRVRLRPE